MTVAAAEPMMEINTTPLIDVLLVLIIMLIITVPPLTHAVKIDVPAGPTRVVDPVRNVVGIATSGTLTWNAVAVTRPELQALLRRAAEMPSEPETHLRPAASAPYGVVDDVLVLARRAHVKKLGFVGNEAYARF